MILCFGSAAAPGVTAGFFLPKSELFVDINK